MTKAQRFLILAILLLVVPVLVWMFVLGKLHGIPPIHKLAFFKFAFVKTMKLEDWRLMAAFLLSFPVTFIFAKFGGLLDDPGFQGKGFKRFLRGTKIVTKNKLAELTRERKKEQVTIGGVPIPIKIETLHFLLNGSTGAGKSVTLREMVNCIIKRGDRLIIVDPDADMFSRFGKKGDILLNPYDKRTQGWSVFNEIKADFDYRNFCGSMVPPAADKSAEEWNGYARVILESSMRVLKQEAGTQTPSMDEVTRLATIVDVPTMKKKLQGTNAESMFVQGADKALGSARFVLNNRLPIFKEMPQGDFSIRDFLANGTGNIYITWREDQATALKPIISAWIDIICSAMLSLEEDSNRSMWLFLDELASMDKIKSLVDALTKGRRKGLRVVAGIQSISQLKDIYGKEAATILMSCFRSLIVMGGSKTDAETSEEMSKALGEHEVIRDNKNRSSGGGKTSVSKSEQVQRERVILPSEISSLPELTGIISFAGDYPICRFKSEYVNYEKKNKPFVDMDY